MYNLINIWSKNFTNKNKKTELMPKRTYSIITFEMLLIEMKK
jgi:hypothetical protein